MSSLEETERMKGFNWRLDSFKWRMTNSLFMDDAAHKGPILEWYVAFRKKPIKRRLAQSLNGRTNELTHKSDLITNADIRGGWLILGQKRWENCRNCCGLHEMGPHAVPPELGRPAETTPVESKEVMERNNDELLLVFVYSLLFVGRRLFLGGWRTGR